MSGPAFEIVIVLVLILFNGVLAMSEMAVVSSRKVRLQQQANEGRKSAQTALALIESPNNFLSTVQIGITLVGVLAGAFGGATVASLISEQVAQVEALAPYSDALGLGTVVLAITYLSLVFGELVPKRLALQNPERVAMLIARPMQILSKIAFLGVKVLAASTNAVLRILGVRPDSAPPVTEEEIRLLLEEGTQAGVFRETEQDMLESVFRLDDRHVSALMTPHTELIWLDVNDTVEENVQRIVQSGYSSYPVCEDGLDNLLGIVRAKDLIVGFLDGRGLDLRTSLHPPVFVPESATASRVVELLKQAEEHVVLVIDEHGGIQGMVTEHDMLEAIVGDIPSPGDAGGEEAVQREDGSWLMDGLLHIDEAKELLGLRTLPGEERGSYQTLGGFVMAQAGRIPTTGDCFRWNNLRFEVVDMDGLRVDKVLISVESDGPSPEFDCTDTTPRQPTGSGGPESAGT